MVDEMVELSVPFLVEASGNVYFVRGFRKVWIGNEALLLTQDGRSYLEDLRREHEIHADDPSYNVVDPERAKDPGLARRHLLEVFPEEKGEDESCSEIP
jgi:hypothetical protein